MNQGKVTRSGGRTAQSSEFNVPAPRLRQSVFAVRVALGSFATATALQLAAPPAFALPTGEVLISGTATVNRPTATQMDITQTTQKAGFNWTSFSIAAPETVNVAQPNSSSVLLNRVVGNSQSQIFGTLNANGKVFLVNQNGILFAPGASVNVGGLVASTLDITTTNFENGGVAGTPYVFERVAASPAASVVNQTNIAISVPGSYAALLATNVSNEGTISVVSSTIAGRGTAALAAGDRVTLNVVGDNLINLSVDAAALGASVLNKNGAQILADGGTVFLTARSADALLGTVINNEGIIQANTLILQDGRIFLDGGAGGVSNSGTLSVGAGGTISSTGGDFSTTGSISSIGGPVDINHTGAVIISGGVNASTLTVTGSGIDIANTGAAGFAINTTTAQTFTATQNDLNITNTGSGLLQMNAGTNSAQTFTALHGDINISSSGTGGVQVQTSGGGSTQTFDTVTGALSGSTGNMTVKGTGGDVRVSSNSGTQTIKLKGDLTVGDAAATRSTELAFNSSQVVTAATINVLGGTGNTAGATLHSFGGQSITATGAINITGGTATAFTVIPNFTSSPSASILNNTTGNQEITAGTINITGGSSGSGNTASIGNFANSLASTQKITADSVNVTGGLVNTTNQGLIQSGNNTFLSTMDLHAGTLTIQGQTSSAAVGGGIGSVVGINVTGDTTLTGGATGGAAAIGLLGTTTNASNTTNFTGTGNLTLTGGTGVTPGTALIGAGQLHTNPTVNVSVSAANITLAPTNGGNAFIGNSNLQPIAGNGNISLTATNGNISINASPDTTTLGAIRTVGATGGTVSLTASGDINVAGRILTSNATDSAIVLRAGNGKAAGDATGGNVKIDNTTAQISVGAGGRATLFTGSILGSTGVTDFIGSGSGHFRYNSNPTTTNYTLALGAGNFAVYREQPLLNVTVTSATDKIYGTSDPTPQTFTAAGYVNGDSAGLTGNFGRVGGESVGTYDITKGTLVSDVGYGFSFGTQALTINPATTTASVANQSKTYGTNDPTLPIPATNLTGLVNTSVTDWNGAVTPINDTGLTSQALTLARNGGENVGSYLITNGTFTAPSTNYVAPTFTGTPTLAINQATLTATINDQSKTYGTDDPALGGIPVNVAGVVHTTVTDWNGTQTVIDDRANVTTTLTSLTRTAGENVAGSPYAITASALNTTFIDGAVGNYAPLTALSLANNPTLAITPATLTATINNQTKTYGSDDPALAGIPVNVAGVVNTTVHDWNGTATLINDTANVATTLTSLSRAAGENVANSPYDITAGTLNTILSAGAVGNYNNLTTLSVANNPTLSITPKSVTGVLTDPNQTKVYGSDDPALAGIGVTVTGLVVNPAIVTWNGTVAINDGGLTSHAATLTRQAGESVGSYDVTAGAFTAPSTNYTSTPLGLGNAPHLTITPATLTATINNQTKTYGDDDPLLGGIPVNVAGVVNANVHDWNGATTVIDDRPNVATTLTSLTRNTGENVVGSPYAITAGTLNTTFISGAVGNYAALTTLSVANNPTLTIDKAATTASVANQAKTYGADDPTLPIPATNVTGLVHRDVTDWNGTVTSIDDHALTSQALTLARIGGENVGSYLITNGTFTAPSTNYVAPTFTGTPTLTIDKAATTASVANQAKTYGADDPTLPIAAHNVTGLVNRTVTDWNGTATPINDSALTSQALTLARNGGENVGSYLITGGTFTAPSTNYVAPTFTGTPTLTINAKVLIVTAQDATKVYDGNTSSSVAPSVSGLVNATVTDWNGHGTVIADTSGFTQSYDNKDVGTGKTLTAAGVAIDGNAGHNYAPTFIASNNGVITRLNSVMWTGAGGNNLWSNAANWQGGAIPDKANVADVNLNGASVVFNNSVPALAGSVQVNNVSGGALTVTNGTLNVANGATLTGYSQSAGLTQVGGNLSITSTAPVVQTGGSLVVSGTSTVGAGGAAITLNSPSNDFKGQLTVTGGTVKASDANGLTIQLTNTGETYVIANASAGSLGDLTVGGTSGNLTAVSNGGTVVWNNLTGANVILIAATPSVGAAGITGLNPTTGDLLPLNTTFTNRGDARGTNLVASGELYIVARDIPSLPADSSARAASAVLDIGKLNPENRLLLFLEAPNGKLRLLVDQGAFRFRGGSQFPGGVSVPDPKKVQVFIGNSKLDATPDAASSAVSAAQQSALNSASSDARKSFGTDSVTQQIDMGFAGDVGIAPTMAHNVPLQGEIISTPEGVSESKGGQ